VTVIGAGTSKEKKRGGEATGHGGGSASSHGMTQESMEKDLIEIELRRLLATVDLGSVSRKDVRMQAMKVLEGRIMNLESKKKMIDSVLESILVSSR
jgi:hypothetical protein